MGRNHKSKITNHKSQIILFRTPSILPFLFPTLTWRVKTTEKELFLTFDDGPISGPTEFILRELAKFNAKATFFCIGDNICKHPEIFQRIVAEGHGIGNHTFHHLKGWGTSTEKYVDNVKLCEDQISSLQPRASTLQLPISNLNPLTSKRLFRPPYGRIRGKQIDHLKDQYKIIMWDVLTSDYAQSQSPEKCLRGSIRATRPGSIVVFHDSLKAERNMSFALPRYLEHFSGLGFTFKILNFD